MQGPHAPVMQLVVAGRPLPPTAYGANVIVGHCNERVRERAIERQPRFAVMRDSPVRSGCVLGNDCCEMLVRVAVGVSPKLMPR